MTGQYVEPLDAWYQQPMGQLVLAAETHALEQILPGFFGYHLLQLGGISDMQWASASPIAHRMWCSPVDGNGVLASHIRSRYTHLPFVENSIDVAILPHILEFHDDPAAVLTEVSRVLMPNGYMVILLFNPTSLWGLARYKKSASQEITPWHGKFYGLSKVRKWLSAHSCTIDDYKTLVFRPPSNNEQRLKKLAFLETLGQTCWPSLGGVSLIVARKQVVSMLSIKPKKGKLSKIVNKRIAEPTTRV